MRFCMIGFLAWLLMGATALYAQSPDAKYVRVYGMIEDADKLNQNGQARAAMTRYLEAQVAMKDLQRVSPEWNPKVVNYRLEYISSQLESLAPKAAGADGSTSPASANPSDTAQLQALGSEIARLASQNSLLEAKVREALSIQPAAIDPRELTRAEQRITALQKERDLLVVTLEQSGSRKPGSAQPVETSEQIKQNVVTQTAVVSVLQRQNEELQKSISELTARLKAKASGRAGGSSEEMLKLKESIAALEASNRVMREEQTTMENRLVDFVKRQSVASAALEGEYEKKLTQARQAAKVAADERDALIEKLNAVTRDLNQRTATIPTVATQELEKQLDSIRAKVRIFEAKKVPFSSEELALFKQAPMKVAAAQTNNPVPAALTLASAPSSEISTAADLLAAQGRLAVDAGRLDEAEKKYRDALEKDDRNVLLLANLAAVQMDQDKLADAEATLKKAIGIDPKDATSLYLLGGVKLQQEKVDEALEALSLSAQIDPERANTQFYLGKALIQQGSRDSAETALRKAVQLKPNWGDAHYLLAVLYATQEPKFNELAQYHYKKATAGGAARNLELEERMQKGPAAAK